MSDLKPIRVTRQQLETAHYFGVDFVPLRPDAAESPDADDHEDEHAPARAVAVMEAKQSRADQQPADHSSIRSAKEAALAELREKHAAGCDLCQNMPGVTQIVFGEGNGDARLMFIGEGPGEEEDRTGRPFVGRAGQKLDEMIRAMGLSREQVYIGNVVKTRPPGNRTPTPDEMNRCGPFLAEQVRIIRPDIIVSLGNAATKFLLNTDTGITRLRGNWSEYIDGDLAIPVMPTFHPAYLLRNYTRQTRQHVWSDLQQVVKRLAER